MVFWNHIIPYKLLVSEIHLRRIWLDVPLLLLCIKPHGYFFLWRIFFLLLSPWPQAGSWSTLTGSPLWRFMMLKEQKHLISLGRTSLTLWSGAPEDVFLEIYNLYPHQVALRAQIPLTLSLTICPIIKHECGYVLEPPGWVRFCFFSSA